MAEQQAQRRVGRVRGNMSEDSLRTMKKRAPQIGAGPLDPWGAGPPAGADELDQLVYLSNLVGRDQRLVQPGGGNSSVKLDDVLFVKGSGTDMRTIGRA